MGSAEDLYKRLADAADVKLAAASTSLEQARIVGDLGIEGVMVVAVLLDRLTTRVDQLESEIKNSSGRPRSAAPRSLPCQVVPYR